MDFRFFANPPVMPAPGENSGFFIWPQDIPEAAEQVIYSLSLVALSYVIVVMASYVALSIARTLGADGQRSRRLKVMCGSLAMGAGIWSMHFIGMLAFQMRMQVTYNPWVTALSMGVAVAFAWAAFRVISAKELSTRAILGAAPLLGFAVCGMHYIGMEAMEMDARLFYRPGLFLLSFVIATTASAAALKMMFHSRMSQHYTLYNAAAAAIMGLAVCGMHYTGMAASVFVPFANCRYVLEQDFSGLIASVTLITVLIIFVAFLAKQLDEALEETERRTAQLFQAQKMEAVGQLTGGIAHDFNNVLNVIIGNFHLLSGMPGLPKDAAKLVHTGMENARRAEALAKRLLAFSRNEIVQPVVSPLSTLVPAALELAKRAVPVNIGIVVTDIPPQLPPVMVDPVHFESAILNLVINARDAMPQGGTVTVGVAVETVAVPQGTRLPKGDYLAITVADTGTGMSAEVLRRAREPFFTTKDAGKGSGMGLAMVAGFAQQSRGDITIRSEAGKGTAITIYIPAYHGPAQNG